MPRNQICSVDGCQRTTGGGAARGLCRPHYHRWQRYGDPLAGARFRIRKTPGLICSVEGCDKLVGKRGARGVCGAHLHRLRRHGDPLAGRRAHKSTLIRDELGRKQCICCEEWLDVVRFGTHRSALDGLHSSCTRCGIDSRHHLTPSRRYQLLAQQDWKCRACNAVLTLYGAETYHIDHDHACCSRAFSCGECIQGLLCKNCNPMLGFAKNDSERLIGGAMYIWSRCDLLRPMLVALNHS